MTELAPTRSSLRYCYRQAHYADVAGPRSWQPADVAAWLTALCLQRDGRGDAMRRAEEILAPPHPIGLHGLPVRERGTLCLAIWEAHCVLEWEVASIAAAFGVKQAEAAWAVAFIAAELRAGIGKDCREGMADVRRTVRAAVSHVGY
jgi:hypothetical protein